MNPLDKEVAEWMKGLGFEETMYGNFSRYKAIKESNNAQAK